MMAGKRYLRFKDLRARGIVNNRPALTRLIEKHGFPPGFLLSENCRVFDEDETQRWLDERAANAANQAPKRVPGRKATRAAEVRP